MTTVCRLRTRLRRAAAAPVVIALAFALVAGGGGTGCERGGAPGSTGSAADGRRGGSGWGGSPPPAGALEELAGSDRSDAGPLESQADPPAPAGDLKAEIDAFTTIDACVAERAHIDPLLGEAIEAIGYDTLLRDACRILAAAKAGQPKLCESIDASSLRDRCVATVAEVTGGADACPWVVSDRPLLGRDPACVAIAERDVRLCAGVSLAAGRATCEAIAGHDEARCGKLLASSQAAACARAAARWRSLVLPRPTERHPPTAIRGALHITALDAAAPGAAAAKDAPSVAMPPIDIDWGAEPTLQRGVVVDVEKGGVRFSIGTLSDSGTEFIVPSPHVRPSFAAALFAPARATAGGSPAAGITAVDGAPDAAGATLRVERAELVIPGRASVATPLARSAFEGKVLALETTRGAPLAFSVDGTISSAAGSWRVHAEGSTFVRDVVRGVAHGPLDVGGSRP